MKETNILGTEKFEFENQYLAISISFSSFWANGFPAQGIKTILNPKISFHEIFLHSIFAEEFKLKNKCLNMALSIFCSIFWPFETLEILQTQKKK